MRQLVPLALLLALPAHAQAPATITGVPTVIDGDTLDIRGTRIRLHGIDAPESAQNCTRAGQVYGCGREAANWLSGIIAGRNVTCVRRDTDRYGRMVATCSLSTGTELNRLLVQQGWALPYLQYGGSIYVRDEQVARAARRGLHAGTFQNPWDYRANPSNPATAGTSRQVAPSTPPAPASSSVYYRNCTEARAAGAAPILRGQPGYRAALDRDNDGVACE